MAISCGHCRGSHETVPEVRSCYESSRPDPASERQLNFAHQLFRQREISDSVRAGRSDKEIEEQISKLSKQDAFEFIKMMLAQPARPDVRQTVIADLQTGMYWNPKTEQIFKVYLTRSGIKAMKTFLEAEDETWSWVYLGRADKHFKVDEMEPMPLERAKEFGRVNGQCCKCGALLTDETSIAEGIGPVCAQRGWLA